jgi:hypothetical protein
MTRRLFIQFGVAALSVAVTTGLASADSQTAVPAPTTPTTVQPAPTNLTANLPTSPVSATTNPAAGQPDQVGGNGSVPGIGSATLGGGSGGNGVTLIQSPDGTTTGPASSDSPASATTPTSSSSNQSPAALTTTPPPTNPPGGTETGSSSGGGPGRQSVNPPANIVWLVQQASVAVAAHPNPPQLLVGTTPTAPPPANSDIPHTAAGFLASFPLLMGQVVIPAARQLPLASLLVSLAGILVLAATAAATRLANPVLVNANYTARLRRSGFLGAARSDVGAAHLLFATPPKMSSMSVLAT